MFNLKVRTGLVEIPTIIVANATKIILVITLTKNNSEDDSIVRVVKLISLNYYNSS